MASHETYVAGRFKFVVRIPREHRAIGNMAESAAFKKLEAWIVLRRWTEGRRQ
jgi:hypothetical protein